MKKIFKIVSFLFSLAIVLVFGFVVANLLRQVETLEIVSEGVPQIISPVVAEMPVVWQIALDPSQIKDGQRFVGLPKDAQNIKILGIADGQAGSRSLALSDSQRKQLVARSNNDFATASISGATRSMTEKVWNFFQKIIGKVATGKENKFVKIGKPKENIVIEYQTPGPKISKGNDTEKGKTVVISSSDSQTPEITNAIAYAQIPEKYEVGEEQNIKILWENNDKKEMDFIALDLNGNNKIDYIEWTVPHLSTQTFSIIYISRAEHLDENKNVVANIYGKVNKQDGVFATIPQNNFIRATFEVPLDKTRDVTVYAKPTTPGTLPFINLYPVYKDENGLSYQGKLITVFPNITEEKIYKVLLTDLVKPTDVFDLEVVGGSIDFDWAVDPVCTSQATGNWNTAGTWDCGHVPTASDSAVIAEGHTVTVDVNPVATDITLSGGSLIGGNSRTISAPVTLLANTTVFVDTGGIFTISGIISGAYNLSKTGGGNFTLSGSNTFSNGLTVKAGTVLGQTSVNAFGQGGISIGDTSGSADARLQVFLTGIITNPITVVSGSSGELSIYSNNSTPTFSGLITLNNNLSITKGGVDGLNITGGITGTGNITISNGSAGSLTLSTGTINNTGTITNAGSGAGSVTISAVIGTNVTGVIQNSVTSSLTLSGANTFTGGLTIKKGRVNANVSNVTTVSGAAGPSTSPIILGSSDGGDATLDCTSGTITISNPIQLGPNAVGTLALESAPGSPTFTGGITGTGNLTLLQSGGNSLNISTGSVDIIGTITNSGAGTGAVGISSVIGSNVTGVIQNSTTSDLVLSGNNTFTSGLYIKNGRVIGNTSANALGSVAGGGTNGTVTLGCLAADSATCGTSAATLRLFTNALNFANPVVLGSGTSGSLTMEVQAGVQMWFSGGVTGNNNLNINNLSIGGNTFTISGGAINNSGTVTNASSGSSGFVVISAPIGSNVTGIIQNSATTPLTVSGAITVNSGGTTLTQTAGTMTISGGTTGTGSLTINDNNSSAFAVSTTSLNHTGTIVHSGSGTGTTNISAVIGPNVTGVIQNSVTSQLTLTGHNTWAGGLTIKAGTVYFGTSAPTDAAGSGPIIIGDSTGSRDATLRVAYQGTYANPITVAGGNSGLMTIAVGNASVTTNLSGAITLNKDLTVSHVGTGGGITLSGGVTGTGNITTQNNTSSGSITFSTDTVNNTGTITNSGTGTGTTTISAVIGSNVTGVIQNSSTSALTLSGDNSNLGILTLGAGTTTNLGNGKTYTIANLVSNGTVGSLATIQSTSAGSAATFTTASAGIATDYLSVKDITPVQTNTWYAGTHSTPVSNTGNWVFSDPPNRFWVGGSGNWNDAANHWAVFSNGTPNASYLPTASNSVFFNESSCESACTVTLVADTELAGLTVNNANVNIAGNYNLSISGNLALTAGQFTAGTVTLTGTSQAVSCGADTSFNNLTFTAGQTVTFTAGNTCTIGGAFTAEGSDGNLITLQSSSQGSAFILSKASGEVSVSYCSIRDSSATGEASWIAATRNHNYDISGNSGWVFNSAPEFDSSYGTNGTSVEQISDSEDAHFGWVKIQYKVFDTDTFGGLPENQGYITPSFWHKNGENWTSITSQYLASGDLDRRAVVETAGGATLYTAYWDARAQITGNYDSAMQIKVGADDGETSNHLGTTIGGEFAVDAKPPVISEKTLDAEADTLTVSATDDSNISYRVSATALAEDGGGDPQFTVVGATEISDGLSVDVADETPTAYLQLKDAFGNLISQTTIAPNAPANFVLKDTSNVSAGDYREFLSWSVYTNADGANFGSYGIFRASGSPLSDYSQLSSVGSKTANYYTDTTVQAGSPYGYKVQVVDTDGDSSVFTNAVLDDAPDGQGGNDVTSPIISSVQAAKIYATWVKITWTTDEPSNSTVSYGQTPAFGQITTNQAYVTSHEVVVTGLAPETEYYFKVGSADISENSAEDDNGGAGYTFTTIAGTEISDVTITAVSDNTATIVWNTSTQSDSHVVYASSASLLASQIETEQLAMEGNSPFLASLLKPFSEFFKFIWGWIINSFTAYADEVAIDTGSNTIITTASASGLYAHKVVLTGLSARSTYYFYVKSTDADGNVALDSSGGSYYSFTTTYDTTPPAISNIATPVITPTNVILLWTTDELADGKVSYGIQSGDYTQSTSLNTLLTIDHVATISGLEPSTKYYYVVESSDANGNKATSEEQEVSTTVEGKSNIYGTIIGSTATTSGGGGGANVTLDTTPPTIFDVNAVSENPFTISVTFKTSEPTAGFVSFGTSTDYSSTIADLQFGTTHTIKLSGLKMGATYHLLASAQDRSGNIGQGSDITVATKFIAEALENLTVFEDVLKFQDELETLVQSVLPSLVPPMVANVKVAEVGEDWAKIVWDTNVPSYEGIDYATKATFLPDGDKPYDQQASQTEKKETKHTFTLKGLMPSTTYHFRVSAHVLSGVLGYSGNMSFSTKANASNVEAGKVGNTDFEVKWVTSQKTSSVVEYTDTATGKRQQVEEKNLIQNHFIKVENAAPNTTYSVRMFGYDTDGNLVEGGTLRIRTTKDLKAPTVSNIKINSALLPGQSNFLQTVISWLTDEPATSQVYYEEGVSKSDNLAQSVKQEGYTTEHVLIVPTLKPSTVYRFVVVSEDQAGNVTRSPVKTVLTPEQAENVIDVIIKNMQESFGFLQKLK